MFKFRATKENPTWDYFLTISHTQTSLIAYRKDEDNNQQYVGLIFRLSSAYGASNIPPECIGGCHCGSKDSKCISPAKEQKLFDNAQDAVTWVMQKAGMQGDIPKDLREPSCFKAYDKTKSMIDGYWNGQLIHGQFPVKEQKEREPFYTGPENPPVRAGSHYEYQPRRHPKPSYGKSSPKVSTGWKPTPPKTVTKAAPKKPAQKAEVQTPHKALTIEEALDDAMGDLKEAFGFDAKKEGE